MRCPKCLSSNIAPYLTVLWKCNDCGAVFRTPLPDLVAIEVLVEADTVAPDKNKPEATS